MNRSVIISLIYLFINSYILIAQENYAVDKWMEYIEEMASQTENTQQVETLYNDLSYLTEHPFDLNTVSADQLAKLPFISDIQIKELLEYIRRYGKPVSLYELKNVKQLDKQTIALLLPFVYIGEGDTGKRPLTFRNILKYGKNEVALRYDQCIQQKKGYKQIDDRLLITSPNKRYIGEPFYNSIRYSYTYNETIKAGWVAEKDAGEPFMKRIHKGYDYYSAHLFVQDIGMIKSIALGDYKASFGQGLIMSQDFTPGRSALITQAERRTNGFRRHFSTNENDFLRGAAATISLKQIDMSLFYSRRKLDATADSTVITSFKTDGLHRLIRDREKEAQAIQQTVGGNVRYVSSTSCLGMTALCYSFGEKTVLPELKPYTTFYFRGKNNLNIGMDYLFLLSRFKFFGETAFSKNGGIATLNGVQLTPASYISLLVLQRAYAKKYQAFFGNGFAQGSSVQNEQGVYMGMEIMPFPYLKFSLYADLYRFPWLKYGVNIPSQGKEYLAQVDYVRNKNGLISFRYKYKAGETTEQHRFRLQARYGIDATFSFRSSLDGICYLKDPIKDSARSRGWALSQSAGWKPAVFPFQVDLYMAYFHTDDYQSRISSYEKNILYAFSMPSFYGKGLRVAFSFRINVAKNLSLSGKLAHVYYSDRMIIGSDLEEITAAGKTDIYTALRWKF